MKLNFSFSNLLGTVYRKGNILFTPDGDTIISPVGNKITFYNLKDHRSETFPIELSYNISLIVLDAKGNSLLAFDEKGEGYYISLVSRSIINRHSFFKPVKAAQFSPDGKYFVVCRDTDALLFKAPGPQTGQYNPFYLDRTFKLAHETNISMDWSVDSKLFAVGSADLQIRVCAVQRYANFYVSNLSGHSSAVVGCFFDKDSYDVYSVDRQGSLLHWQCLFVADSLVPIDIDQDELPLNAIRKKEEQIVEEDAKKVSHYKRINRFSFHDAVSGKNVQLVCAAFHKKNKLLVTGHSNGAFLLHEMPEFSLIHSLSITDQSISSIALNAGGDWIGVASSSLGQLLVWEWQSETYIMKQQGHFHDMNCLGYSPDGQYVATGGQDSKVKLWTVNNGFCFATFSEHTGSVTGVAWTQGGKAIVSSSLDGTVRAFDLKRYRNFRTFVSPQPVQFSCVCVDHTGDIVCAGGQDVFDIFVWSLNSGKLLDVLSGHEAPVSGLHFNSHNSVLASGSWDKTLRIWDVFEGKNGSEVTHHTSDILAVQFSPDGKTVACSTLDCQIYFYDWRDGQQIAAIEGKFDLDPGRGGEDEVTAKKSGEAKAFTTLCFSPDGEFILAAGMSRNICIYNVDEQLLVKKFLITCNRSLDYVTDDIDRRKMSEFGNLDLIDDSDSDDDGMKKKVKLPGVKVGDLGRRSHRPEVRVFGVQFSPTGRAWAICSTEGLLVYSLDRTISFDPFQLESNITPSKIRSAVQLAEFSNALVMALKLNESSYISEVLEKTPVDQIDFICRSLPLIYVEKLLSFVGGVQFGQTNHVEFYLIWIYHLLLHQGLSLKSKSNQILDVLTNLQQVLTKRQQEIGKICEQNKYSLNYILALRDMKKEPKIETEINDSTLSDDDLMDTNET